MQTSQEFINVSLLAKAVADQLRNAFDPHAPLKRVFNMEDAALYCGMPVTSFKAKVIRDRIRKVKLDRCWRFDRADLDAWIESHREEVAEEEAA